MSSRDCLEWRQFPVFLEQQGISFPHESYWLTHFRYPLATPLAGGSLRRCVICPLLPPLHGVCFHRNWELPAYISQLHSILVPRPRLQPDFAVPLRCEVRSPPPWATSWCWDLLSTRECGSSDRYAVAPWTSSGPSAGWWSYCLLHLRQHSANPRSRAAQLTGIWLWELQASLLPTVGVWPSG